MSAPSRRESLFEGAGDRPRLGGLCWRPWPCAACGEGATPESLLGGRFKANGPLPRLEANALIDHITALEQRWLLDWVRSCDHTKEVAERLPVLGEGSEHAVFLQESAGDVIKVTLPGIYGDFYHLENGRMAQSKNTPGEYLVRMRLVTETFGLPWNAIGIMADGRIVSRQQFIQGEPPTQREVNGFLLGANLQPVRQEYWLWKGRDRDGVEAWIGDARADNFVRAEGGIVPIDLRMWNVTTTAAAAREQEGGKGCADLH